MNAPAGIELASLVLPELGRLLMVSLVRTPEHGEVLEIGNWLTAEPLSGEGDPAGEVAVDGLPEPPGIVAPMFPLRMTLASLPDVMRLVEQALAALPTVVLDNEGWASLAADGPMLATVTTTPQGTRLLWLGWHDLTGAVYLPLARAVELPGLLCEAQTILAGRHASRMN